jgi:hypothetical protein
LIDNFTLSIINEVLKYLFINKVEFWYVWAETLYWLFIKVNLIVVLNHYSFYLRIDIWDSNISANPASRSGIIGSTFIAGVCSNQQYSIVEYAGLSSNAAHELGHK